MGRAEEREANAMIGQLEELKRRFISSVSHELRTPLSSIIGFTSALLEDEALPAERRREFLRIMLAESERLELLINDLLDLQKLEQGMVPLCPETVGACDIIQQALDPVMRYAHAKSITIESSVEPPGIRVFLDPEKVSRALRHMVDNAIKFTHPGGTVKITARVVGAKFEIVVHDNGAGIPSRVHALVFDKFFQLPRPACDAQGTGIGLAIVKHLVELHGGTVSVLSQEGSGSAFTLRIPVNQKV